MEASAAAVEHARSTYNADESLIPRSPWKLTAACLAGLTCWGVMLWLGIDSGWKHSALEEVVSLDSGRIPKFFSTVALLGASQLATLILWYRSKSRKDFAGRYRIWAWASIYWSLLCLGEATGFHLPLAAMLYDYWQIECWRPETVYWLGPVAAGFVALYTLLGRELRQSLASRLLWNLCAACGAGVALLTLGLDVSVPQPFRQCIDVAAVTFWHYLVAATFLVHARFVVHVNNEAAPKTLPAPNRLVTWYLGLIRKLLMIRWPKPTIRLKWLSLTRSAVDSRQDPSEDKRHRERRSTKPHDLSAGSDVTQPAGTPLERTQPAAATSSSESLRDKGASAEPIPTARKLRIDPPQTAAPAPRSLVAASPVSPQRSDERPEKWPNGDEGDFEDEFSGIDFDRLSRKERRKLKKLRRTQRD